MLVLSMTWWQDQQFTIIFYKYIYMYTYMSYASLTIFYIFFKDSISTCFKKSRKLVFWKENAFWHISFFLPKKDDIRIPVPCCLPILLNLSFTINGGRHNTERQLVFNSAISIADDDNLSCRQNSTSPCQKSNKILPKYIFFTKSSC